MARNKLRGLYAVTPDCADRSRLLADVEGALTGGCRIVQYRDKTSTKPEQLRRAKALRDLAQHFSATLLINDDLALAALVGADGVHLGQDDGNLIAARAILGPDKILGASCYADLALAAAAHAAGADQTPGHARRNRAVRPSQGRTWRDNLRHRRYHAGQRTAPACCRGRSACRHHRSFRRTRHRCPRQPIPETF